MTGIHQAVLSSGGKIASLSFLQLATETVGNSTTTFSAQNLGAASGDRTIIVAIHWYAAFSEPTLISATIAGVSATIHVQNSATDGALDFVGSAIVSAEVPTGASGDIVFTLSFGTLGSAIGVYRAVNMNSQTAHATSSDDADVLNLDLNIPTNGITLATATMLAGAISTSGVTEDYDQAFEGFVELVAGSAELLAQETPRAISFNGTAGFAAGVAASWR